MKRWMQIAALVCALLMISACTSETAVVPVVQMRMLTQAGAVEERFAGVVVSENAVQVHRDLTQSVEELYVSEGEAVEQGQLLFRYDSDALNLTLDKQELEQERLDAEIKEINSQIKEVEKELKATKDDSLKTQLNIQLRQLQTNLTEAQYDREDLLAEIEKTEKLLKSVEVKSPISGTVRKIDETAEAYIVIQQTGAFQVQGTLNELSLESGIQVGASVVVVSRLDETKTWTGTVVEVDYSNASSNSYDSLYGGTDPYSSTSSYPFRVMLDSTEGLLLGQHVYIRPVGINEGASGRILIPQSYIMDYAYDEQTMITSATVWCAGEDGKLVKQNVVLGQYVENLGCYVVLEGLTMDSYVADPANPDCAEGVMTDLRAASDFAGPVQTQPAPSTEATQGTQETQGVQETE